MFGVLECTKNHECCFLSLEFMEEDLQELWDRGLPHTDYEIYDTNERRAMGITHDLRLPPQPQDFRGHYDEYIGFL